MSRHCKSKFKTTVLLGTSTGLKAVRRDDDRLAQRAMAPGLRWTSDRRCLRTEGQIAGAENAFAMRRLIFAARRAGSKDREQAVKQ